MDRSSFIKFHLSSFSNIVLTFLDWCWNVSPVLIENEQERFDLISSTLEQGQFYTVKDILRSKSFLQTFAPNSEKMVSNGGDNAEEKSMATSSYYD